LVFPLVILLLVSLDRERVGWDVEMWFMDSDAVI